MLHLKKVNVNLFGAVKTAASIVGTVDYWNPAALLGKAKLFQLKFKKSLNTPLQSTSRRQLDYILNAAQ